MASGRDIKSLEWYNANNDLIESDSRHNISVENNTCVYRNGLQFCLTSVLTVETNTSNVTCDYAEKLEIPYVCKASGGQNYSVMSNTINHLSCK